MLNEITTKEFKEYLFSEEYFEKDEQFVFEEKIMAKKEKEEQDLEKKKEMENLMK